MLFLYHELYLSNLPVILYYVIVSFFWSTNAATFTFSQLGMVKQTCYSNMEEDNSGGSQASSHSGL